MIRLNKPEIDTTEKTSSLFTDPRSSTIKTLDISELEKYFDFSKPFHPHQTLWSYTDGDIVIPPSYKNYKDFPEFEDEEDFTNFVFTKLWSWTKEQKKILSDKLNINIK